MKRGTIFACFLLTCSAVFSQVIDENGTLTSWPNPPKDVVIPEGVKRIGEKAFVDNMEDIESLKTSSTVEVIDKWVLFWASNLKRLELNEGLKEIGYEAFCLTAIEEINIPNSVEEIGSGLFADCTSLKKATIGKGVKDLTNIFSGCVNLSEIIISPDNPYIEMKDNAVLTKDGLSLQYYMSLDGIDEYVIPNGVKYVEMVAFHSSKLKKVTIPASVENIDRLCFVYSWDMKDVIIEDCPRLNLVNGAFAQNFLSTMTIKAINPPTFHETSFGGSEDNLGQKDCTLYIPEESWDAYEQRGYFEYFKEVKPIKPSSIYDEHSVNKQTVTASCADGNIQIEVENPGCYPIKIFSGSGVQVYSGLLDGNSLTLPSYQFGPGIYVVVVGNTPVKLVVPRV